MEYQLNLGAWNSIFAVPSAIVDKHIKLAGAAQLKVILWVLRHAGENFTAEDIAKALSMHEADVRDSMQYWIQTEIISVENNTFMPTTVKAESFTDDNTLIQDVSASNTVNGTAEGYTEAEEAPITTAAEPEKKPVGKKRALSRPEKPDVKYLIERMRKDQDISFLMQSADEIFGRMTSNSDKATLLMIHEYDGLPVDVLIMLLQYAFSVGKGNMRYIEKMAISWSDEEIVTLEAAEKKIKQLTSGRNAAKRVQRIFGQDDHSPTEKETELADLWINKWKLSDEMLRAAYEACVDNKGKYIANYIGTILEKWYQSGVRDISKLKQQTESGKPHKAKKAGYQATYDIGDYESTSVLDEEWDD